MSTEKSPSPAHDLDHVVESLAEIGAIWARYGLTIGKSALETSAKTLSASADLLGDLAKRVEKATNAQ